MEMEILFEDRYILVVNKPEGLLTNSPDPRRESAQTMLNGYLEQTHQRCRTHTIHRLDRETSGLLLFAKE